MTSPSTRSQAAAGGAPSSWAATWAARSVVGLSLLWLAGALARGVTMDYAVARERWWAQATGFAAGLALLTAWLAAPLLRLGETPRARRLAESTSIRRTLGLAAAAWGVAHAGTVLGCYADLEVLLAAPFARAGLYALAILAGLALLSWGRLRRALRFEDAAPLYRLVDVAVLLGLVHVALAPQPAPLSLPLGLAIAGLAVLLRLARILRGGPR